MKNLITNYKIYENINDPYGEEKEDVRPFLKKEKKTCFFVDYDDFNEFVRQVYGNGRYNFVAEQEANNYSIYRFDVDGRIANYDQRDAEEIRNGHIDNNNLLFNVLCADGYIEPGEYLVEVYW